VKLNGLRLPIHYGNLWSLTCSRPISFKNRAHEITSFKHAFSF